MNPMMYVMYLYAVEPLEISFNLTNVLVKNNVQV